ncbi:MAG: aminopeptidase [Anaerolineales bacterium]|nr:aminopeptidase [Anaerolineales bacterium]
MADLRIKNYAKVLVEHSARVAPGDRILLEGTTAAEPLLRELYIQILEKGGHPHLMMAIPGMMPFSQDEMYLAHATTDEQIEFIPTFYKIAYAEFEGRIRVHSATNTHGQTNADPEKSTRRAKALSSITGAQFSRGGEGKFKWVTTLYPTSGYAQDANMSLEEYEDFVFNAVHANEADPIAFWKTVESSQQAAVDFMKGKSEVVLRGPNVDLKLSVKDRIFMNSFGTFNMPDGEIYTGPVEESLNGWVKYTYPANYGGVSVENAQLTFKDGKVIKATADKNEAYLNKTLDTDANSRYVGEFAIGTNFDIQKFTGNILFDEKIGGSFHMALGAGYPETGSKNKSSIHWDMICDLRTDSEILVDGELFYKNGKFVFGK